MNIYLLTPLPAERHRFAGYDVFDSFVVIATDQVSARTSVNTCADECRGCPNQGGDGLCVWHDPNVTDCESIGVAHDNQDAGIVLESFKAG